MPRKINTDHIVLSTENPEMKCLHCGAIQPIAYPIYLTLLVDLLKSWGKMHRHCKKPPVENENDR